MAKKAFSKSEARRRQTQSGRNNRDDRDERNDRPDDDDRRDSRGPSRDRSRGSNKGDRLRLTGLWETKRRGLFAGTIQDKEAVLALVENAIADEKDLRVALFENDGGSRRDPQFTVYMNINDQPRRGGGRSGYGRRGGYSDNRGGRGSYEDQDERDDRSDDF